MSSLYFGCQVKTLCVLSVEGVAVFDKKGGGVGWGGAGE